MGLRIATNVPAQTITRILTDDGSKLQQSYQRLASGQRITRSGDDAAGLAISENLRAQLRSTGQVIRNANDGVSFIQVAEGGLTEVSNIMIRLRELAIQGGSDTVGDEERGYIHAEAQSLIQEVDRISNVTNFNGTYLLNGGGNKSHLRFQVGINNTPNDEIVFDTEPLDSRADALGIDGLNFKSLDDSRDSIQKIDEGMSKLFANRSLLGAMQNKLQSTVRTLEVSEENISAARSGIADTDIAAETSNLVKENILQSVGIAVLAQANIAPGQATKLLS